MTLAWGMRCFILDKKMGLTPLWPMYLASSLGILISYPNLPGGILSLSWIAVGLVSLYILKELHARELPGIENNLLHVHRLTVWLSMAVAAIGWPRMAILVLILVDCLAINTQFIIGLLQILNRSSDVQDSEQHAQQRAAHAREKGPDAEGKHLVAKDVDAHDAGRDFIVADAAQHVAEIAEDQTRQHIRVNSVQP